MSRRLAGWALCIAGALGGSSVPAEARADAPAPSLASQASLPSQLHTLSNGLRVVLAPDRTARRVAVRISYQAGTAHDPKGMAGMGRLVGLLLEDPSTRHVPRALRSGLFRALGVQEWTPGADVDLDDTAISFNVAPSEVGVALWLESDRMGFFLDGVDETEVRKRLREVTHPTGGFEAALRFGKAALFGPEHPYAGQPEMGRIGAADVRAHFKKHFVPRNTIVTLAGNFDAAAVKAQVEESFGPVLDAPRPAPVTAPKVELAAEKRVQIEANVPAAQAVILWPTPPFLETDDLALDGVAYLLRRRLEAHLVKPKLATSTWARQISKRLGSAFYVAATAGDGQSAADVERLLLAEIERVQRELPAEVDATRAARELLTGTLVNLTVHAQQTYYLATFLEHKQNTGYLPTFLSGYESLSPRSIQAAAQKYLSKGRVVVTVTPNGSAPAHGRAVEGGGK